ncbi:MAG: hypothetical protein NWE81_03195 [Candidatus Bathyarchaeota archaeon]|nr:hypothetical protein [Candidatus Bathyarchaeota archaeon]
MVSLEILADFTPFVLILGGVVAASWLVQRLAKPAPVVGEPVNLGVRIASLFGFFVGVAMLVTAVEVWSAQSWDNGTTYLLVVTGLALVLKPLKDIPWASLLGLIAGLLCVGAIYLFFPLPDMVLGVSSIWIYLLAFFVPALIVYMIFRFIENLIRFIGAILGSRPVLLILGLICMVQGVLLLLDMSIFTLFSFG